jgi:flagellar motor switch protein FliN/FliY
MSDDKTPDQGGAEDAWAAAMAEQGDTNGGEDAWADALNEQAASGASEIAPAAMKELSEEVSSTVTGDVNLDMILDIPVDISLEIGRTKISIRNLLQLTQGSVVELDRLAGEPLDVMVNGTLIAHGEVVVVNEKFGIRLTDVISATERIKRLK